MIEFFKMYFELNNFQFVVTTILLIVFIHFSFYTCKEFFKIFRKPPITNIYNNIEEEEDIEEEYSEN